MSKQETSQTYKEIADYDSTADTLKHIKRVSELMSQAAAELLRRGSCHDDSKLIEPEKSHFDRLTPLLKTLKYGTKEYTDSLADLKPALDNHYAMNSHHPEHYETGIDGMDIFDLVEMFFDWKAATERTSGGSIKKSIEINSTRFKMSEQLVSIYNNTADRMGFL